MAKGFLGENGYKAYLSTHKLKAGYIGNQKVYSAGHVVTYNVDLDLIYQEEVDEGETCLAPKTFIPEKSGWTFLGWREDNTANEEVLGSKLMGEEPLNLYAVFVHNVTLTCSGVSTQTGNRYYNNKNIVNPTFTVANPKKSGYTFNGWSLSSGGSVKYSKINNLSLTSNTTLYPIYTRNSQTVTVPLNSPSGGLLWQRCCYENSTFTLYGNLPVMYEGTATLTKLIDCTDYKYAKIKFNRLYVGGWSNPTIGSSPNAFYAFVNSINNKGLLFQKNAAFDVYNAEAVVNISNLSGNKTIGLYCDKLTGNGCTQMCVIGDVTVTLYN